MSLAVIICVASGLCWAAIYVITTVANVARALGRPLPGDDPHPDPPPLSSHQRLTESELLRRDSDPSAWL